MRRCKLGFLPHLRHFGNFGRSSVRASCVRSRAASSAVRMGTVIEPRWLNGHLSDVTVLDASWYMPGAQRDPDADFLKARIPGMHFSVARLQHCSPFLSRHPSELHN